MMIRDDLISKLQEFDENSEIVIVPFTGTGESQIVACVRVNDGPIQIAVMKSETYVSAMRPGLLRKFVRTFVEHRRGR